MDRGSATTPTITPATTFRVHCCRANKPSRAASRSAIILAAAPDPLGAANRRDQAWQALLGLVCARGCTSLAHPLHRRSSTEPPPAPEDLEDIAGAMSRRGARHPTPHRCRPALAAMRAPE